MMIHSFIHSFISYAEVRHFWNARKYTILYSRDTLGLDTTSGSTAHT